MENPFKYTIVIISHEKVEGHYNYTIKITINDSMTFNAIKRFSELKALNDVLKKESTSNNFPKFPPKKFFTNEEFIKRRQQELNVYFNTMCNSPEFSKLPSLIKFVKDCLRAQGDNKKLFEKSTNAPLSMDYIKTMPKSIITPYRQSFKPSYKCDIKTINEMNQKDEEYKNIVEDFKAKFVDIDFQVKPHPSENGERKYKKIMEENNVLNDDNNNKNIEQGNDGNYNLINGNNDNINEIEKEIGQKLEEIIMRGKEIVKIYNFNQL